MTDISFIIVSWNAKEYLDKCLKSMYELVHDVSYETIVVDNGSDDGSVEIVKEQYPWVKLIETGENLGFAKANNVGIRESMGRYICLVNSDVVFIDNNFSDMIQFADKHIDYGLFGPRLLWEDMSIQPSCMRLPRISLLLAQTLGIHRLFPIFKTHLSIADHQNARQVEALVACFWLLRRNIINEIGLLDGNLFMYGEEFEYCTRMKNYNKKIYYYPYYKAIHFGRKSSEKTKYILFLEQQKSMLYCYRLIYGNHNIFVVKIILLLRYLIRLIYVSMLFVLRRNISFKVIKNYINAIKQLSNY